VRIVGGTLGVWLLIVLLIGIWAVLAMIGVFGARALGIPAKPVLAAVSVLFFVLLWSVPVWVAYRLFWGDQGGTAEDAE